MIAIIALVLAVVSILIQLISRFKKTKYKHIKQDMFVEGGLYVSKDVTYYVTLEEFEKRIANKSK